jgi:DNA mismatch repair protein MutS
MSIARALVEYIHKYGKGAKTLFATHYHELNDLEEKFPRVKNWHIAVKEQGKDVIFLRKLEPGGVAHSFGIHVARLAGMPMSIVRRADAVLKQLEATKDHDSLGQGIAAGHESTQGVQMSFFQLDDPILCQIRDEFLHLDINNLTPIEALNKLNDIKRLVKEK